MARLFNGSSDYATQTMGLAAFNKITTAFWLWNNTNSSSDGMASEYTANASVDVGGFFIDPNSGSFPGNVELFYSNTGGAHDVTFTQPSQATWHHWALTYDTTGTSAVITHAYIDGSDQSLTTRINTGTAAAFANSTMYFMSRAGISLFNAGRMAEFSIWSDLLTQAEVSALAKGYSPQLIRISKLVHCIPWVRANTEVKFSTPPTLSGTSITPHPRIIMPVSGKAKRFIFVEPPPAPPLRAQIWM